MLGKNSGQVDVFDHMIFEKLTPKDHLLVKIDSIVDFSFVYDKVQDKYSSLGRGSKDPIMMLKILVLEYLYRLSDKEIGKFDEDLAKEQMDKFESEIDQEYENNIKVRARKHYEIAEKHLNYLYLKTYGTIDNRAYPKDNEIVSNIAFYKESSREKKSFGLKDFEIDVDVNSVVCPNGIKSTEFKIVSHTDKLFKKFKIDQMICNKCEQRDQCFNKGKNGKSTAKSKFIMVPIRYDAMLHDMIRVESEEFEKDFNKRYKVERRFATLVLNHGLRRCRYIKLERAKVHITLANMACKRAPTKEL